MTPLAFEPVLRALSSRPRVSLGPGWGKGNVVAKLGGKMFAMLVNGDLVVKLPRARVDSLIEERVGARFDPRRDGRLMKEWVVIAEGSGDWVGLSLESLEFVSKGR